MDITIHATCLPYYDPDASLAFYRDALGFVVRADVRANGLRWITVGSPAQLARIILATANLDGAFERLEASGGEVIQEPITRPDGARDCAFFDPAYNLIRINELCRTTPI